MFPRESGHAASHFVPGSIAEDHDYVGALEHLRETNTDLRRGDLIRYQEDAGYRNNGVAIFDGEKIVDLYTEIDDYGSLPEEFRVIEENVPIGYWRDVSDEQPGIAHNNIVWFDHRSVRDQALANIQLGKVETGEHLVFTTFIYNDKEYRIIFDPYGVKDTKYLTKNQVNKFITKAREQLSSDKLIIFGHGMGEYGDTTLVTENLYD